MMSFCLYNFTYNTIKSVLDTYTYINAEALSSPPLE